MNMMKTKFFALLFIASAGANAVAGNPISGNPFFLSEANKGVELNDIRFPLVAVSGMAITIIAAFCKLADEIDRKEFLKKHDIKNANDLLELCKKIIPSTSTLFLLGGILLTVSSKNIIYFFDACFKNWAADQLEIYKSTHPVVDEKEKIRVP